MDWKNIGETIADFAPMLGGVLGGPGGAGLGKILASKFGSKEKPEAVMEAINADPNAVLKLREIEDNNRVELQRLLLAHESKTLTTVNETMRAEYLQGDLYTKRWRPTFGYVVAFTWAITWLGIVAAILYCVIGEPQNAAVIFEGMATIMMYSAAMWSVALSILGVSVAKRSHDKQVAAGQEPTTLLGSIARAVKKQ